MIEQDNNHKFVAGFEQLLRSRGYVGYFELYRGNRHEGTLINAPLVDCLRYSIVSGRGIAKVPDPFILGFCALQKGHNDYIRCFLKVEFNSQTGFEIKEMDVQSENPNGRRHMPIGNNQQLLNVNSVRAMFPRPSRMQQEMKDRLKGKRPW